MDQAFYTEAVKPKAKNKLCVKGGKICHFPLRFLFFLTKKRCLAQKGEKFYGPEPKDTAINESNSMDLSWLLL